MCLKVRFVKPSTRKMVRHHQGQSFWIHFRCKRYRGSWLFIFIWSSLISPRSKTTCLWGFTHCFYAFNAFQGFLQIPPLGQQGCKVLPGIPLNQNIIMKIRREAQLSHSITAQPQANFSTFMGLLLLTVRWEEWVVTDFQGMFEV